MAEMEMMGMNMAGFAGEPGSGKVSGALVQSENHIPFAKGVVLCLNANPDMNPVLSGFNWSVQVVLPKTSTSPELGYMAFLIDTEGNKVGLHSQSWLFVKAKKEYAFSHAYSFLSASLKVLFI